jgi:hypothetical protein
MVAMQKGGMVAMQKGGMVTMQKRGRRTKKGRHGDHTKKWRMATMQKGAPCAPFCFAATLEDQASASAQILRAQPQA